MADSSAPEQSPRLDYVLCTNPKGWHRMAFWEWGDADNDHIMLCVHGLTRNGRDFDALAQRFSDRYRVICPDMAGRGQSDWFDDPDLYNFAQYVGDIATLIARLQPRRITWVGTSMGGLISLSFVYMLMQVARGPLQVTGLDALSPEWLRQKTLPLDRLVLNDIGPELALGGLKTIASYVEQVPTFDTFEQAENFAREHWTGFGLETDEQWAAYTRHYYVQTNEGWQPHYDPAIIRAFVRGLDYPMDESQKFLWSVYAGLSIPTLVLRGQHSDLLTKDTYERMLAEKPLAQGHEVQRAGHAPSLLFDDELQLIEDFLSA